MAIHLARSRTGETGAMANLKKERKWRFHGRIENMKTFGFSNWCVWRVLEFEDKALHNMPQFSKIHNNTIWFPIEFIRRLRTCLGISRLLVPIFFSESEFPKPDSAPENDLWIDLKTPYFRVTLVSHSSHSSCFRIPKPGRPLPQLSRLRIGNDAQIRHSVDSLGIQEIRRNVQKRPTTSSHRVNWASQFTQHRVIEICALWLLFSRLGATAE